MINVFVNDVVTLVSEQEVLTRGSVNARKVQFSFSEEWEGLNKTAVFTNGTVEKKVPEYKWEEGNIVSIPPEVLAEDYSYVQCGIYGKDDEGTLIFPTIWAKLGKVQPAPYPFSEGEDVPTTPTLWEELQLQIGNLAKLTTKDKTNLVRAINEVYGLVEGSANPTLVQPDYLQNDSTAEDYIKNRPFYVSSEALELELPSTGGDVVNVEGSLGLILGNIYTVFDGEKTVELEAVDFTDELGFSAIGLPSGEFTLIDKVHFSVDTEEVVSNTSYYILNSISPLKITGEVAIVKRIEEQFLPDNVVTSEKLDTFKDKYIDYTSLYSYDMNEMGEISVSEEGHPLFEFESEVVNSYAGQVILNKEVWYTFKLAVAKVTKEGEIIPLIDSPLKVEYNKDTGYVDFINAQDITDCGISIDGDIFMIGASFKEYIDGEIVVSAHNHITEFRKFCENGDKIIYLNIICAIGIVLGEVDGVPYYEIFKEEFDTAFEYSDGFMYLEYHNETEPEVIEAHYLGGNG